MVAARLHSEIQNIPSPVAHIDKHPQPHTSKVDNLSPRQISSLTTGNVAYIQALTSIIIHLVLSGVSGLTGEKQTWMTADEV